MLDAGVRFSSGSLVLVRLAAEFTCGRGVVLLDPWEMRFPRRLLARPDGLADLRPRSARRSGGVAGTELVVMGDRSTHGERGTTHRGWKTQRFR